MQWLAGLAQNFSNNIGNSPFAIAPFFQCINATAYQYEPVIFNKFIMNSLSSNVLALANA